MKIKVGDKVTVITGSNKGKEGKVLKTLKADNRVIIEGINIIKKHVKPNGQKETGGIVEKEAPIHVSNVKLVESTKKETKAKATKKVEKTEKVEKEVKKTSKKAQKED